MTVKLQRYYEPGCLASFQDHTVEGTVLVYFTAIWCSPCRQASPVFSKLSDENENIRFLKIDVDQSAEIAQSVGIKSIPTFLGMRDGKELFMNPGWYGEASLRQMVEDLKE